MKRSTNNTHVQIHNIDISKPIDVGFSIKVLGDNPTAFYSMIKPLAKTIDLNLTSIAKSFDCQDWKEMRDSVHQIKGASAFIGAGRIYYACYYIQESFSNSDFYLMQKYYPLLIEACVSYKTYSCQLALDVERN